MHAYPLFLLIAIITVLTPGPGVVMTLTNALRGGIVLALAGIAVGTLLVATAAATGLGVLLATSAMASSALHYLGALYLCYRGARLYRSPGVVWRAKNSRDGSRQRPFLAGVVLQLGNPKALVFFVSVLPQFVDHQAQVLAQGLLLVLTYSALVLVIHLLYAHLALRCGHRLDGAGGGRWINRIGGGIFCGFGIAMVLAAPL